MTNDAKALGETRTKVTNRTQKLEPAIIVLTGAMAAGKSTIAQLLAEQLPCAAHVRGDLFRRMIVSGQAPMSSPLSVEAVAQLRLRQRLAAQVADGYAAAGITAIVQDILLGDDLPQFLELLHHRPVFAVVLAPDAETLARRDATRIKTGYVGWTSIEFDRELRETTPPIGLWLDTSRQSPGQTVSTILSRLADAQVESHPDGG